MSQLGCWRVAPTETRDRVDDDRSDLAPADPQQLQGGGVLVLQNQGVRVEAFVARALHDPVPPAVVGALEDGDERAPRVEARLLHGAHHGLGAAHVEGDLLLPEDAQQHLDVLRDDGVHGAEAGAQLLRELVALAHELLKAREAEAVHAIGAGGVEEAVALDVHELVALRFLYDGRGVQRLIDDLLEDREGALEARGLEAEVREVPQQVTARLARLGPPLPPRCLEAPEAGLAPGRDVLGRGVDAEELLGREVAAHEQLAHCAPYHGHQNHSLQCLHKEEGIQPGLCQGNCQHRLGDHRRCTGQAPSKDAPCGNAK
mmetsp:Transcript_65789/g.132115  ORF Transcript_65789/g.132115 Transcript_65789/m.132115 type:complete len:316 (-) Transcript_65789:117-1064(-)